MTEPWLSVVMPVHGGAAYLGATLESAAAEVTASGEDPAGIEFRLYDSGEDGGAARAIAQGFAEKLSIVWQDVPAMKPWTAKTNLGVSEARASHVVMLHQDDLWLPGHLAALRAALAEAPAAVLSLGPSRFVGPRGQALGPWRLPFAPGRHEGRAIAHKLLVQNSVAIPAPLIARGAWLACGGLEEALWYSADWDLYLKLAEAGEVHVRPAATTAFRVHATSLTMTGSRDAAGFRAQLASVLERHLALLAPVPRALEHRARAGVALNCALAGGGALPGAALQMLRLGPVGAARFLAESRIVDRVLPRLRLRLKGAL